eukprot:TRINITY_DN9360_c0_g1_i1.p1 TRINITY_DN9360_c0_g1~~TRINITY_DN9360_c0_g1_i1.p1  ORF type:complete len:538 (-),score=129.51 TRINITY_DN9360_c0_g1_i1:61-1557(-)
MLNIKGLMAPVAPVFIQVPGSPEGQNSGAQTSNLSFPTSEEEDEVKRVKTDPPSMKYGRVNSMLVELLGEYKGKPFQAKLENVLAKATQEGQEITDGLPARWELARTVHADILARHGFQDHSGDGKEHLSSVLRAVLDTFPKLLTKVEAVSKALQLKGSILTAEKSTDVDEDLTPEKQEGNLIHAETSTDAKEEKEEVAPEKPQGQDRALDTDSKQQEDSDKTGSSPNIKAASARPALALPKLTRSRALALQVELFSVFSSPKFQKQLGELARKHKATEDHISAEYRVAFKRLVRKEQFEIIPRYGFQTSEEGVEDMLFAYSDFQDDLDIYVNSVAIEEALYSLVPKKSDASVAFEGEPGLPVEGSGYLLENKAAVKDFLLRQLQAFSVPQFQRSIMALKLSDNPNGVVADLKRRCNRNDGYYHLSGRSELALLQQAPILEYFGFEGNSRGLQDAILKTSKYLDDPEVAELLDSVNAKLGMSPEASSRFRKLARSLVQ